MRFCDKLPKLRKEKNLSQEQLADRLNVSRQAVSKWENGSSYPDMDKIMLLCDVLDCTLDELLDDGVVNSNNATNNKFNINNYVKDFLKFITSIYNMFRNMSFKQIVKCFLEMVFIFFILLGILGIVNVIIDDLILDLVRTIPYAGIILSKILGTVVEVALIIIGIIIFIHLFKIRYLDYYITIEDKYINNQETEELIDKKENISFPKKEKIIIRDPKHSTLSFFDALAKVVILMIKVFVAFIGGFGIISFVGIIALLFIAIYHIQYSTLFIFIAIALVGSALLNYDILEIIYKFVVDKKQSLKKIFLIALSSFILIGMGIGISSCIIMNFDTKTLSDKDYLTYEEHINIDDKTIVDCSNICEYKIDDNANDVVIKVDYLDGVNSYIHDYDNDYGYKNYFVHYETNFYDMYDYVINDLKNSSITDYEEIIKVTIITSQANYDKLNSNHSRLLELENE
ncbi:MAG: helix-turn-helix domain-containing protein [Bacilli bacterium]